MKQCDLERLTAGYEAAVHHPEVSGMEHLQLFQIRSQLADYAEKLSATQQEQLHQADQVLLTNADCFVEAINEIADLSSWRNQRDAPAEHWWWYLDVIVHLPTSRTQATFAEPALV
jgi:hypothetical protein